MHPVVAAKYIPPGKGKKAIIYFGSITHVGGESEQVTVKFEDGVDEQLSLDQANAFIYNFLLEDGHAASLSHSLTVALTQAREAIAMYKGSGRSYIGQKLSKDFSGKMHNGVVKSFAGKAGTEFVKKGGKQGGASDYWMVKWDDKDFGELNKAELLAGLRENAQLEREASHRFDTTLVVGGEVDLRALACLVPSKTGTGLMVASLKVEPSSEVIRSLKLLEGHDDIPEDEDATELSDGEFLVEKIVGHTAQKTKPRTTVLGDLPETSRCTSLEANTGVRVTHI